MRSPGNKSQLGRKAKCEDRMIMANEEKIKKIQQKCAARFKEVAQISTWESELGSLSMLCMKQYHCMNAEVKIAKSIKNITYTVHYTAFNTKTF